MHVSKCRNGTKDISHLELELKGFLKYILTTERHFIVTLVLAHIADERLLFEFFTFSSCGKVSVRNSRINFFAVAKNLFAFFSLFEKTASIQKYHLLIIYLGKSSLRMIKLDYGHFTVSNWAVQKISLKFFFAVRLKLCLVNFFDTAIRLLGR